MDPESDRPQIPFGDALNDVPLFREIQRVLMSSSGPVNWELARQVGVATATWGQEDHAVSEDDRRGLADTVRAAELAVADFTGLAPPPEPTRVEAFRRAQWVEANVHGLRELMEPVAAKLAAAMSSLMPEGEEATGGGAIPGMPVIPGMAGGGGPGSVMDALMPLLLGAQVGGVLGFLAQGVLGQYDLPVPREGGSLYFVVPNIARLEADWSLPPVEFRAWVALHEVTHRFEFGGAWVRPHFLGLVRDLIEHAELDLSGLQRQLEGLDLSDMAALSETMEGMGNLFGRSADPEQRLRVARVQSFLAAAEGHGDHVMETLGRRMLPAFGRIEEAMLRHREGRHGDQALERLLGIEMTTEQYRLGREFCRIAAEQAGEDVLAGMWGSADALPSMPELQEPTLWLARTV